MAGLGSRTMVDKWREIERQKYEAVWGYEFYRDQADGDPVVEMAFQQMGCKPGETLTDWGCGKGTPAQKFVAKGLKVTGFDIAYNCLDKGVNIPLVVGCMWDEDLPPDLVADYAFCTDVLEHLPPDKIGKALDNIADFTCKSAFIQVCTALDTSGRKMDPPMRLHLTVMPWENWAVGLSERFNILRGYPRGKSRYCFVCDVKDKC